MTIGCASCRARLAARVAGRASEADALEVEAHLQRCEACREEHARWSLVSALKTYEPELSPGARDRVVRRLVDRAITGVPDLPDLIDAPRRRSLLAPAFALSFAAAIAVILVSRTTPVAPARVLAGDVVVQGKAAAPGARIDDGASLVSTLGGSILLDGPRVDLGAGSRVRWSRGKRTVDLEAGQVEVDVVPGQGQRFRVAAERFIVEVVGTHFTVTPRSVSTTHGTVRVLDRAEREIARVGAGETWTIEGNDPSRSAHPTTARTPGATPSTPEAPSTPPIAAAPATLRPVADATPSRTGAGNARNDGPEEPRRPSARAHSSSTSIGHGKEPGLLDEARAALANGEPQKARQLLHAALAVVAGSAMAAEARLLFAESFLVEKRHREAIRAYQEVARRYAQTPQAESALFAAAELQLESGKPEEARRGLEDYLRRYPHGRYQAEAVSKLSRLSHP